MEIRVADGSFAQEPVLASAACCRALIVRKNQSRLDYLDASRGIAAVLVVLHHAYQIQPFWPNIIRFTPFRILLTGRAPVIFFFLLSGYVLSYAIWNSQRSPKWSTYASRRGLRIYIPYAVSAIVAALAYCALTPKTIPELGVTFNDMWSQHLSAKDIAYNLLLVGTPMADSLNSPSWSLVYELRISVFMPLLCGLIRKYQPMPLATLLMFFILIQTLLVASGLGLAPYASSSLLGNMIITLHFTCFFVAGMILANISINQSHLLFFGGNYARTLMSLTALGLLLVNRDVILGIGALLLLYMIISDPRIQKTLANKPLLFLGRISFSLYLTHMILFQIIIRMGMDVVPVPALLVFGVFLAVPVAYAFNVLVERPAHLAAKRFGRQRQKASPPSGTTFEARISGP